LYVRAANMFKMAKNWSGTIHSNFYTTRDSSRQNENSVINYSPSCRSKLVRLSFTFRTQMKMRDFCFSIDSYATNMLTLQKDHNEIVKVIHMN